jgi:hypothetical protein
MWCSAGGPALNRGEPTKRDGAATVRLEMGSSGQLGSLRMLVIVHAQTANNFYEGLETYEILIGRA